MKRNGLKDKLLAKYGTISSAANALGWDRKKLYRVLDGQILKEIDIADLVTALDMTDAEDIVRACFPTVATMLTVKPVPDTISGPETAKKLRESYVKNFFGRLLHRG